MANNITIDSSVLISSLIEDEKFSKISKRFISFLRDGNYTVHAPITVLLEVLKVYYRKTTNREAVNFLYQRFMDWNITRKLIIINVESYFLIQFMEIQRLYDLKTADAIIATTAHLLKYPLITWDEKMLKHCKRKITCMTPKTFLKKFNK
ncbi:type II toxin-antitoxin system VapC family toxin [Candidatus Peregrinibacteria bacterium]|nr:type II toxin-antitoxin system VapC family toxin [Candidatus Peregrinibacteria bacterium]